MAYNGLPVVFRRMTVAESKRRLQATVAMRLRGQGSANIPEFSKATFVNTEQHECWIFNKNFLRKWLISSLTVTILLLTLTLVIIKMSDMSVDTLNELLKELQSRVIGQHVALGLICKELERWDGSYVLLLHFLGSQGTGKTLVSNIIARHYQKDPRTSVQWHLDSSCPALQSTSQHMNLLIFDDYDISQLGFPDLKMGSAAGPRLVIISSNWGSSAITKVVLKNRERAELNTEHFVFLNDLRNDLEEQWTVDGEYKEVLVPFLPLERTHVRWCLESLLESFPNRSLYEEDVISAVVDSLPYFPPQSPTYSLTGCKKIPLNDVAP